jgi:hypothetical protein
MEISSSGFGRELNSPTETPVIRSAEESKDDALGVWSEGIVTVATGASSNKVEEESSTKKPENQVVKPDVKDLSLKISDEKDSALANVEIKSEEPLVDENSSEENVDSDYPNGMSAESIVRDNKIVLRPEPTDLRPIEVNSQGFDEVSIDELDEYIK